MKIEEALDRIPDYLEGSLSPEDRSQIDRYIAENVDFAEAVAVSRELEMALTTQEWIEPSAGFTWMVLGHAGLVHLKRTPVWVTAWERAKTWVSVSTLFLTLAVFRDSLINLIMQFLRICGTWLDGLAGTTMFAVHPLVVVGILSPIVVGGFATCVLTGRCKVSS